MENLKNVVMDDNEIIEKTGIAPSNFRLFRKFLKRYGLIKNAQKLTEDHMNMLIEIKDEKEDSGKNWEDAITDKIKEVYPDAVMDDNRNENENINKEIQSVMQEIQAKYKEIDKLKEKAISLIEKLK